VAIDETLEATYTRSGDATPAVAASWTFTLRRVGETPGELRVHASDDDVRTTPIREPVADPDRDRRRDVRLAAAMSSDELLATIDRFDGGAKPAPQFVVHAGAWLRLHPEEVSPMVAKFAADGMTARGRGLVADLLAEAGTLDAQGGLRDALSTPAARTRPSEYAMLVQRFTFVTAPDEESVAFLEREYDERKVASVPGAAEGVAVALGSVVRRLANRGEDARARQVDLWLHEALREASTSTLRGALVAALGNAGRPEDVADLVALADDPDARVRDRVATALRSVDSPEARRALFSLATDASSAVAISAYRSLKSQSLDDADWRRLVGIARDGRSPAASDATLVLLVREKAGGRVEGRDILAALLERNDSPDNDLGPLIRETLQLG
jgi:HEAT repeat protein